MTRKFLKIFRLLAVSLLFFLPSRYCRTSNGTDNRFVPLSKDTLSCVFCIDRTKQGYNRMDAGFNYELLKVFSKAFHCSVEINCDDNFSSCTENLVSGNYDIVISNRPDSVYESGIHATFSLEHENAWLMNVKKFQEYTQIEYWMLWTINSSDIYEKLRSEYYRTFNPQTRVEKGLLYGPISPYDELIRKESSRLGWDWRKLASVIYQESMFSICIKSPMGAMGLMQVLPRTAEEYGVKDLITPEKNINAGTSHLIKLQRYFLDTEISEDERFKFTIASYNAGLGRIEDIRNLASMMGMNPNRWEDTIEAIPYMRNAESLDTSAVKLGTFQGYETIAYVESVQRIYEQFCTICPE